MRKRIYGIFLLTGLIINAFDLTYAEEASNLDNSCTLPKGSTLRIACTTDCGWLTSRAVESAAKKLGYKVELVNIHGKPDLSDFDALIVPGGADIHPKYYTPGQPEEIKKEIDQYSTLVKYSQEGNERDPFEYNLLKQYFADESKLPVLGICRGMQMLTVVQGIPLYVDIKTQLGINNRIYTIDKVTIQNIDSEIGSIMRKDDFWSVQLHHQGLHLDYFTKHKEKWPNLEVTALSNGGKIAEVLEFKKQPVLGVQFHPEYTLGSVRNKIFSWLVEKACQKKL